MSRSAVVAALIALGVLHAAARRSGRRAVDVEPARRPPLRHLGAARLRGRHRGGPLPRHGLPHPRRDGRRLDAADQARSTASGSASASAGSARPRASPAATATCGWACPAAAALSIERTDFVPGGARGVLVGLRLQGEAGARSSCACRRPLRADVDLPLGRDDAQPDDLQPGRRGARRRPHADLQRAGHAAGANAEAHDWAAAVGELAPAAARAPARPSAARRTPVSLPGVRSRHADAARPLRRHRVRQGQGRRAAPTRSSCPRSGRAPCGSRSAGSEDRRRGRGAASSRGCSTDPARAAAARRSASARRCSGTRSSTCRATRCSRAASTGASRTSPTPCRRRATSRSARPTRARTTRRPRARSTGRASRRRLPRLPVAVRAPTASTPPSPRRRRPVRADQGAPAGAARRRASITNGDSGKVVHEVITDGSVYFGANADAGNTDETAKFPSAVALIWRWTGDNAFRDEMYAFAKSNLRYIFRELDEDSDGWPEGLGNVERARDGRGEARQHRLHDARAARPRGHREVQGRHRDRQLGERARPPTSRRASRPTWWMDRDPAARRLARGPGNDQDPAAPLDRRDADGGRDGARRPRRARA